MAEKAKPEVLEKAREQYDLALSFSGAQRAYVQRVSEILSDLGVTVFFDEDRLHELIAADLASKLPEVYGSGIARHCVVFLSKQYMESEYTRLELSAALGCKRERGNDYLILARFDGTEISELSKHVVYIDARIYGPTAVAYQLAAKLGRTKAMGAQPEIVISIGEKGYLDVELLKVSCEDFRLRNPGAWQERLPISVRFPDYIKDWCGFAVNWMVEHRRSMLDSKTADEGAFQQVTEVVTTEPDRCKSDIRNGINFVLRYCFANFRLIAFDQNENAIATMVAFVEARFHKMVRYVHKYRIRGMPDTPWLSNFNFGVTSWSPSFVESLALNDRTLEYIPIWVETDTYLDGERVGPNRRPFVPLDVFMFDNGVVTATSFAKVLAPQLIASAPECFAENIQSYFVPDFDYAARIKIINRDSEFIEKQAGYRTNKSHFNQQEQQALISKYKVYTEKLERHKQIEARLNLIELLRS
jgi:hypothetical protein